MEVHGKQPDGQDMKYCQPCLDDGEQVAADGICQECDEFMCQTCITAHRRFRQFRNHIILEGYAMAQWASSESSLRSAPGSSHQESYETCSIHQNELVKFYCRKHDQVGCGDCVVLDHRSCKVDYITDVVKQIDINREVTVLQESLKSTNGRVSGCLANMAATVKSNDDMNVKATKDIGQFAQEMIEYIQSEEKKLLKSVKKIKEDDNTTAESRMEKCQEEKRNVDAMEKRLRALTGIDVRTFTIVKSVKSELASTEKNVDKISKECETSRRNYSFKRNKALVSVVSSHSAPPLRHDRRRHIDLYASDDDDDWRVRHTPSRDHCQPLGTLDHMRVRQAKP